MKIDSIATLSSCITSFAYSPDFSLKLECGLNKNFTLILCKGFTSEWVCKIQGQIQELLYINKINIQNLKCFSLEEDVPLFLIALLQHLKQDAYRIDITDLLLWDLCFYGQMPQYGSYSKNCDMWCALILDASEKRKQIKNAYAASYVPHWPARSHMALIDEILQQDDIKSFGYSYQTLFSLFIKGVKGPTKMPDLLKLPFHRFREHYQFVNAADFSIQTNQINASRYKIMPQELSAEIIQRHLHRRYYENKKQALKVPAVDEDGLLPLSVGPEGQLPNEHHIIWVGVEIPELYKLQIIRSVELNPHYVHNLWWCPKMLPTQSQDNIKCFAARHNIILKDVLHYDFENRDLIIHYLLKHDYARFSDILRLEEVFAGIYTDTDVCYLDKFPTVEKLTQHIKEHYRILVSEEFGEFGISNSLIIRPYGCKIMEMMRKRVRQNLKGKQVYAKKQAPLYKMHSKDEVLIWHQTGPRLLANCIAREFLKTAAEQQATNLCHTSMHKNFDRLVFTRAFKNVLDVKIDSTWTEEGRAHLERKEYLLRMKYVPTLQLKYRHQKSIAQQSRCPRDPSAKSCQ